MTISISDLSVDMGSESKDKFVADLVAECGKVLEENSGNRCAKYCKKYLESEEGKNLDGNGKNSIIQ